MLQLRKTTVQNYRAIKNEAKCSKHINIVGHYNDTTLIDKDGHLIRIFQLSGIDHITKEQLELDIYKHRKNSIFKTFNSNFAVYSWIVRKKTVEYPDGEFNNYFSSLVNEKYKVKMEERCLFHNVLYLALITKAPEGKLNKLVHWLNSFSHKADKLAREDFYKKMHENLEQVTHKFLSTFSDYQIRLLGIKQRENLPSVSEPLTFIDYLINGNNFNVLLGRQDACFNLPRYRPFFNARSGTIELRAMDNSKRFAAVLSLKSYADHTFAGLLDHVQKLPIEMIITQSFRFFDPQAAKTNVRNQRSDFAQAQDESVTQQAQLSETLDEVASGEAGQGLHHLTVVCLADTQEQLNRNVADIVAAFAKHDMVCIRETLFCEMSFWAQLPGNFSYIGRGVPISTKNLAGFMSQHNSAIGKIFNNFWGPAVTILETMTGSPYYFNYHYKDVGNTLCIGGMGSGKTLILGFLLIQSLKFGGKRVVFDKDRGLEILVRALGGNYEVLKPGISTGFNPCQLSDTPENRNFLTILFKKLLTIHGQSFDENDAEILNKVIKRIFSLPMHDRRFQHIAPFFGPKMKGSLRARFEEWHSEGNHAWLFDNTDDRLNLAPNILGFELGKIFEHPECRTPALMYLTYRVSQALEGHRGGILADEVWRALEDDYFKKEINDYGRTPRKKNNFLCLATQSAEDIVNSPICRAFNESAACKLLFPNPQAKKETYVEGLGLSEREYELIKTLESEHHYFLLNYGRGKESTVLRANLEGLEDEIAVISGREENVRLVDKICSEVGNDPQIWLPIFHQRRKEKHHEK